LYWLLSAACLSFGFGQLFKWAQRRGCHAPTVIAANYLALAAVLAVWHAWTGNAWLSSASLTVGGAMGGAFLVAMRIMTRGLERAPVGVVLTAFRLAILVPVVVSVWLWDEALSMTQAAGVGLAVVGLALMTTARGSLAAARVAASPPAAGVAALLIALGVFASQGLGQVCLRWVHYAGLDEMRLGVLMICAATAGGLGGLIVLVRRGWPGGSDVRMGVGIGLYNLVCLATILTALSHLEGTLFFPVTGCLVVILDGLCAHFGWKERLGRVGAAGAGLAAVAMLLVL
jgi:hypothetical protein